MGNCGRSHDHYRAILATALNAGYRFCDYAAARTTPGRVFLLRHDIDVDPFLALDLARIENELGISATYFVRVRSPFYNAWAQPVAEAIREIGSLGGDIQLHFDGAGLEDLPDQELVRHIEAEARLLEAVAPGSPVTTVAFHRPSRTIMQRCTGRFINAYDAAYVRDMHYISDSGGAWRSSCICELIDAHERLHCLIHPVWWSSPERTVPEAITAFLNGSARRMDEWLAREIRSHTPAAAAAPITSAALSESELPIAS